VYKRQAQLFQRSCVSGVVENGCSNLAVMYEKGRGVAQDYSKALNLYQQGCSGGNELNCYNLGLMYEEGRGVSQSDAEALVFYSKSCELSDKNGCEAYSRLRVVK